MKRFSKVLAIGVLFAIAILMAADLTQVDNNRFTATPVIANGTSQSDAIATKGATVLGVQMPAAWDAASISFLVSADGVTYGPLKDSTGSEITISVSAGDAISLAPADFAVWTHVKIRSGTSGAPVNQTADRAIKVMLGVV